MMDKHVILLLLLLSVSYNVVKRPIFFCRALSAATPQKNNNRPVKRIAVIGSGISGLSVAHALANNPNIKKHQSSSSSSSSATYFEQIDIFDSRPALDTTAGAGIQLNGGLVALGLINRDLQDAVYDAGLPQVRVQSRCKPWFGNNSSSSSFDTLLSLDLRETVRNASPEIASALLEDWSPSASSSSSSSSSEQNQRLWWTSIMRGALQQVLLDELTKKKKKGLNVRFGKRLTRINENQNDDDDGGCGAWCQFADGTESGPYDLIVGCEGINSPVKNYIDNNGRQPEPQKETADEHAAVTKSAIYSGLRIRYAITDGKPDEPIEETATLTQYFGDGAYALVGTYGSGNNKPNTKCSFIVYLDPNYIGPFKRKDPAKNRTRVVVGENADWSQDNRKSIELARNEMLEQLQVCGIPSSPQDDLGRNIRQADRFFELGSYFHNPFCKWSRPVDSRDGAGAAATQSSSSTAHVVLCGDAAHALPPFLGQGSNQAIQDAYCLVQKIFEYNNDIENGSASAESSNGRNLQEYFDEYEQTRWLSCFNIFWKAAFLGYLETGGINGFYAKGRDLFFRSMGIIGVAQKVLLGAATPRL